MVISTGSFHESTFIEGRKSHEYIHVIFILEPPLFPQTYMITTVDHRIHLQDLCSSALVMKGKEEMRRKSSKHGVSETMSPTLSKEHRVAKLLFINYTITETLITSFNYPHGQILTSFKLSSVRNSMHHLSYWAQCLTTDPEVLGSIPRATRISEEWWAWNMVHSASLG
jgi:hypothetical protein